MPNLLKLKRGTAATIPVGSAAEPLFTTDTYDLYIGKGNGSNQRFQKYIASGTSSQFLKGDGSLDSTSYQTALTFSSPLVNTSGTISIPAATGSVNGYLTSTDWTTFNSKEPAITAGTSLQYYRGDKTFQTLNTSVVPESGAVYFTEPRVLATVLTGLNLSGGGTIAATDSVLTAFGKIQNQISGIAGGVSYQTTWNASTNTPTLTSSVGTKGYYYVVSVAGSTNLNGITDWKVGDWAIFNGTTWDKVDNTDAVSSVNGFTGAVNLGLGDISNVTLTSPTNGQLLRFNGTSSKWENFTSSFITLTSLSASSPLSYNNTTGAFSISQSSASTNGYLSSTDWTTFNNKQAALTLTTTGTSGAATLVGATLNIPQYQSVLTNPVTGTGTNNYIAKFTATGSTIGDSSLYYSQGANFNAYTFGSVGVGAIYNISQFNIYSNATSEAFLQWGSNKYLYIGNSSGNVSFSSINTGTHNYNNIIYYNGASASDRYISFGTEAVDRLTIEQNGDIQLNKYTSNGFVKTSGGVGTITIDTTSYLPLTGGTLTGALSGTSATFSSFVQGDYFQTGSNPATSGGIRLGTQVAIRARNVANTANIPLIESTANDAVEIASGGASVGIGVIPSAWGAGTTALQLGNGAIWKSGSRSIDYIANGYYDGTNYIYIQSNAASYYRQYDGQHIFNVAASGTAGNTISFSPALTISSTGAATFSSSVGIGGSTVTDGHLLNIIGNQSSVNVGVVLNNTNVTNARIYAITNVNGQFSIYDYTASAQRFYISSTGAASFSSSVTQQYGIFTGTTPAYPTSGQGIIDGNSGNLRLFAYGDINFYTSSTQNVVIKNGGNVGIGTTSPSKKLEVAIGSDAMRLSRASAGEFDMSLDASGNIIFDAAVGSAQIFRTNGGSERMRITSGGVTQFNGTDGSIISRMQSSNGMLQFYPYFAAYTGPIIQALNGAGSATVPLRIESSAATFTGTVTATSFFESSDMRLKSNIQDYKSNDILNISAKIYEKDGKTEVGYLAQDLENVLSSAISVRDNGYLDLSYRQVHTAKIAALEQEIKELKAKLK